MNLHAQEKYEKAMASLGQMEQRVVMAESMLEATIQYQSGKAKALSSPRYTRNRSSIFLMNIYFFMGKI